VPATSLLVFAHNVYNAFLLSAAASAAPTVSAFAAVALRLARQLDVNFATVLHIIRSSSFSYVDFGCHLYVQIL
jgi:hypothetical protein